MTPHDIQNKRFDKAMSGYKTEEVHTFLASTADYVEDILEDKAELERKLEVLAEKLEEYREDEDSLRAALIGAQKLGDSVVRESKKKAEIILAEAERKATQMLTEASEKSSEMIGDIRANIDKETMALHKLEMEVAKFKRQILALYQRHIELINAIPYNEEELPDLPEPVAAASPDENPGEPADKAKDFVVVFEEVEAVSEVQEEEEDFPKRKPSRFGTLRFGDEYSLKREGD